MPRPQYKDVKYMFIPVICKINFKGTVYVISSDPLCKGSNELFTKVPLKALSDILLLIILKSNFFKSSFSTKSDISVKKKCIISIKHAYA